MELSLLKNKKIAILGIGYIGSNILNYLKKSNVKIIAITRKNINIIETDEFDYFINASGNSGDFRQQIIETIESNLSLNCYILEKAKIKYSYIYFSSSRVYGFSDKNIIFDENCINYSNNLDLDFIYDGTKKLTESLLFNYSKKVNYNIAILRLSNVYGKFNDLDDSTLIKKIIRYKKESITSILINQNRYSTKDYVHINDVISIVIHIMINIKKTDVYNLACNKSFSLDDISKILDYKVDTNETIKPVYSNLSNYKITNEFDINFKYNFENELKQTIKE